VTIDERGIVVSIAVDDELSFDWGRRGGCDLASGVLLTNAAPTRLGEDNSGKT
jgi:hypothetical protein